MSDEVPSEEELAEQVKGKTLQVYWFMLRHPRPMSAREIQRGTELSSPSLSLHHLEKLRQFGLVDKNVHGEYEVTRDVRVGILRLFVGRGRAMVPKYLFYATFYTSLTAALSTMLYLFSNWYSTVLILLLASACVVLWYEALTIWREQPFPERE
ncbi:MAG: transcriptional regulator [Candidatus Thorarchaeota archaeon]|nr:transcriptional regulator [Candidatus Thorarchaeota archaeon]